MGNYQLPKRGRKCVIKHDKKNLMKKSDWDDAVKCHKKAKELAAGFNTFSKTNYPIYYTDLEVFHVTEEGNREQGPYLNEYFLVEVYIEGSFTKWCNNYGYCNDEAKTSHISMSAFMHWSWAHTKGELMIADLQGVRYDNHYVLTDPAIYKKYGITDTGVKGMFMFFHFHSCNSFLFI